MSSVPARRPLEEEVDLCLLLASLVAHWGVPDARWVFENRRGLPTLDVFSFPGSATSKLRRFVTFGVADLCRAAGKAAVELFFVLPRDLGGADEASVRDYLVDIAIHAGDEGIVFEPGTVFGEGSLAPASWAARGAVIHEATGEPECLETHEARDGAVRLLWVMPAFQSELALVRRHGLDAWAEVRATRHESVVDPRRPPFVKA
jgi:hypothetical protein